MKKIFCLIAIIGILFALTGCTKTVHCDRCNKEIAVKESSDVEEDWIVYCDDCNEEIFEDDPIIYDEQ